MISSRSQRAKEADAVVDVHSNYKGDQDPEEHLSLPAGQKPGQFVPGQCSANAADAHDNQHYRCKGWNRTCHQCKQQARDLREQDNIDRVFRCRFHVHGKQEKQNGDVDWSSADAEKR